jgi:hypothetical protein
VAQLIFLGVGPKPRLRGGVLLAEFVTKTWSVDLDAYPRWLVVLVATLVASLLIWIVIKVSKLALWLVLLAVLIGGTGYALWLLVN